jgi:hypothetical protein
MAQLDLQVDEAGALWREDSAIWAIIAGEVLLQHDHPLAKDARKMIELGATRAEEAAISMEAGNFNAGGHSLIGCAMAVALAARPRAEAAERTPIEAYASELADALSWQASEATAPELTRLADEIRAHADGSDTAKRRPTLWELAIRAGGHAVGLSQHIIRRRERRDLIEQPQK